jgi:hypothetical protein
MYPKKEKFQKHLGIKLLWGKILIIRMNNIILKETSKGNQLINLNTYSG